VVIYDFGDMQLHNYNDNPDNGVGNSTYVIESENSLVLIDSQFFPDSATDFRAYADTLGKPIDRILLTHGHPDHVSGLAVAFADIPSYSSAGVIEEALADSGSVIDHVIERTLQIDGITYTIEVRQNLEAVEQIIITLPDYGIVSLGDVFYNGWHAVMNPGFDGWIAALEEFEAMEGVNLFLAGHGPAGVASDVGLALAYLQTGRDTFANSTTADEFIAAMVEAYPDTRGPFLLALGAEELLFPPLSFEVDFGDCTELAMGMVAPLASLQDQVPEGVEVLSLTAQGTVFEGSDALGVLIARVVACDSITVTDGSGEAHTDTMVHFAHVGTPVDVSTFPATPYNTDGTNGADFNNYVFAYTTDSPAYVGAMQDVGVVGAALSDITLTDTPAGDCMVERQVSMAGGPFAFEASGTVPDASCEDPVVPFVGNWWSVVGGHALVLSNNIPGQAAVFIDVMTPTLTLQASASDSALASVIGADPVAIDAFALTGFLPEADGIDMIITDVGEVGE
ncbi:MAG: MBL fold metallo-hydrolase, partial [Myxococcota bacterium]